MIGLYLVLLPVVLVYCRAESSTTISSSLSSVITPPHQREEVATTATGARQQASADEGFCTVETCENIPNNQITNKNATILFEYILAHDYEALDGNTLLNCIASLKERGAHRCWHKHSTFLDHLLGVHHILRLWGQQEIMGRVGLFHSAYSNSYVNLALYNPNTERHLMQSLIGNTAEELVYLFCIIDRQAVVVNQLLVLGYIPSDGLYVPHLRIPIEQVYLSSETIRNLVIFSMADTSEQYFGWQDDLFGKPLAMLLPGQDRIEQHQPQTMWPGVSKPGIWMTYVNQLAMVARTFYTNLEDNPSSQYVAHGNNQSSSTSSHLPPSHMGHPNIPPVFDNCTKPLHLQDEIKARDIYWNVVMNPTTIDQTEMIQQLLECCQYNPWIFEPWVLLAQQYLYKNEYEKALTAASNALRLQQQWGTAWDKRLHLHAWVAWTRVLHQRATQQQPWPTNSWDVNNFGLVYNPN
jgi:hypothetical protein